MALYRIPLTNTQQRFTIELSGKTRIIELRWNDQDEGGWFIDWYDGDGNPVFMGMPLVTGADLLEQFTYLGADAVIAALTDGDDMPPTFDNLGTESNLYYLTP